MSHKFCILCLKIRISFHFPSSEFPAKPTEKITTLTKFNSVSFLAFYFFALNFSVQCNFIIGPFHPGTINQRAHTVFRNSELYSILHFLLQ